MLMEFNLDFGYRFLYSRRHYHPAYCWDGTIECTDGRIVALGQLAYPESFYGPVHSPTETPLDGSAWKLTTHRDQAGIHVTADCSPGAVFCLKTAQGQFTFSARQVLDQGRIVFPVGSKYSHCTILVTRQGHLWFRPKPLPLEAVANPVDFRGVDVLNWSRMDQAWIAPGGGMEFELTLPNFDRGDDDEWLLHLQAMTAEKRATPETQACAYIPMELWADGRKVCSLEYYLRHHDCHVQVLHDVWARIPLDELSPGVHQFRLVNRHEQYPLLVNRVSLRPKTRDHLAMQAPVWALVGQEAIVSVYLHRRAPIELQYDPRLLKAIDPVDPSEPIGPGLCEVRMIPLAAGRNVPIQVRDRRTGQTGHAAIAAVYDLQPETSEVKVGYDMTTVPHDATGEMDWLLDYTHRTQLGNLVVFRPFNPPPIDGVLWRRWGEFCNRHRIHVQAVDGYQDGNLIAGAGPHFMALGGHELSMFTYYGYPDNQCRTMKESVERYLNHFRQDIAQRKRLGRKIGYGDAGGGHRYTLAAGADFIRAETMVAHTMQHLSQCRPAAQAIGDGQWGVHIAIQHCKQPYLETHLGMYYLSLLQPWMMGASFLYEEDSLFLLFKEERQCWDDALTKGKRDMTREFFRFAATHPRIGRPAISIGILLGRYAAPFNGFTCIDEVDPSYSVWGTLGRSDPAWGHHQPEKAAQLVDVLMPGASTHPLRQRHDKMRFYFSGTPYGDFDQTPIEADAEFLSRYRLLMLLGWNTMIPEDFARLKDYVSSGGTLLLGVPQLSTHEGREFLRAMEDLSLFNDGDVRDLCGVRIIGRGERYSGRWQATDQTFGDATCPPLSRIPSVSADEDGPCHLAQIELHGARPVIVDGHSQKPLLVEYALGRGRVYLLTTWAYPGHEELSDLAGAIVARLAQRHMGEYRVDDPDREVFWTRWPEGDGYGTLMLLNTDWSVRGNRKQVAVKTPAVAFETEVLERQAKLIKYLPFGALTSDSCEPHVEFLEVGRHQVRLCIHATGHHRFSFHSPSSTAAIVADGQPVAEAQRKGSETAFELTWTESTAKEVSIAVH